MQKDKILGPDAWLIEFFKRFLDIFYRDLLVVIEESIINGRVMDSFNSTFIALIPKVNNVNKWENFIPIPLCV